MTKIKKEFNINLNKIFAILFIAAFIYNSYKLHHATEALAAIKYGIEAVIDLFFMVWSFNSIQRDTINVKEIEAK